MHTFLELVVGAEGIVEANLVPILVKKLKTEVDELKVSYLKTDFDDFFLFPTFFFFKNVHHLIVVFYCMELDVLLHAAGHKN